MANFGDFKGVFNTVISYLKSIDRSLRCLSCGGDPGIATAGTEADGDIPAGLKSLALVKTSSNADDIVITFADGTTYTLIELGEVFTVAATAGSRLPAYQIATGGTFKWHGIK